MIRTAWTYAAIFGATIYCGGRAILYHLVWPGRFRRLADRLTGEWASLVLRGAATRVAVVNGERIGLGRGQILIANHRSWFDVFALGGTLGRKFSFVGKREVSRIPVVGAAWEKVGHIGIDRSDRQAAIASLARADELLREGRTIIVFPEGTRSATGELGRFKKGAFVMAIKSQVPVLPVGIVGTRRIMPKGRWRVSAGRVTLLVGRPIGTEGMTMKDRNRLSRRCRQALERLLDGEGEGECRRS